MKQCPRCLWRRPGCSPSTPDCLPHSALTSCLPARQLNCRCQVCRSARPAGQCIRRPHHQAVAVERRRLPVRPHLHVSRLKPAECGSGGDALGEHSVAQRITAWHSLAQQLTAAHSVVHTLPGSPSQSLCTALTPSQPSPLQSLLPPCREQAGEVVSVCVHPTNSYLITAAGDGSWAFYDVAAAACVTQVGPSQLPQSLWPCQSLGRRCTARCCSGAAGLQLPWVALQPAGRSSVPHTLPPLHQQMQCCSSHPDHSTAALLTTLYCCMCL